MIGKERRVYVEISEPHFYVDCGEWSEDARLHWEAPLGAS